MSRRGRTLLWIGACAVVSVVYLWLFGVQTFFALESRHIARKAPVANIVPTDLVDLSVSKAQAKKLAYLGYEFEIPWDVDESKTKAIGNKEVIVLQSGNAILLCVVPPRDFINSLTKETKTYAGLFTRIYGPDVLQTTL